MPLQAGNLILFLILLIALAPPWVLTLLEALAVASVGREAYEMVCRIQCETYSNVPVAQAAELF